MEDLSGKEHVNRVPVLISGVGVEQLLGVPKLASGTGVAQAAAVINCIQDLDILDRVVAICFDTTASKTGVNSGACTLIQKKLERRLLFLACRYHVMELILGAAFQVTIGGCSGPVVQLFKRLKERWQFINIANFQSASTDPSVEAFVATERG